MSSDPDTRLRQLNLRVNNEFADALSPDRDVVSATAKSTKKCSYVLDDGTRCNKSYRLTIGKRHSCRYCMKWYCHKHTHYVTHGSWTYCQLNSKCVCDNCARIYPLTPTSKAKKNHARPGKKVFFGDDDEEENGDVLAPGLRRESSMSSNVSLD